MKIGILSDTHKKEGRSQKLINHLKACGAEFLIHAGDIVKPEILEQLKQSGLRYIAVYGNNDAHLVEYHTKYNLVQEPHYFKLGGAKFKLMHLPFYLNADAEIIIFGHTHVFECDLNTRPSSSTPAKAAPVTNRFQAEQCSKFLIKNFSSLTMPERSERKPMKSTITDLKDPK